MHHTSDAADVSARAPADTIPIALYSCLKDTAAQVRSVTWEDLAETLSEFDERESKDGTLWSPVTFKPKAPKARANVNIESVNAFCFDYDHREPPWSLLDGLEYRAHTTHTHHADDPKCGRKGCPHWRVVVRIAAPIAANDYPEAWQRLVFWLAPEADQSCKDESRGNYLPSCLPGAPRDTRSSKGAPIDWKTLRSVPEDPPEEPRSSKVKFGPATDGGERPGDRFNREASWEEILGPTGAQCVATLSDGSQRWRRPGKRDNHSATTDGGGKRVLYIFTDEWKPFAPKTSYTRFRAYSLLNHGGDDSAAAKELAERYSMNKRGTDFVFDEDCWIIPPGRNGHASNAASANGTAEAREPAKLTFQQTEMGMAELLVNQHGGILRYCHPWSAWLENDGRRWRRDLTAEARRRAKATVRSLYAMAAKIEDDKQRRAVLDLAKRFEKSAAVSAMLRLAEAEPGIPILPEQMDAGPLLFNVQNGTVDLRTGQLRPHNPLDYITKLAPVAHDATATCPTFLAFLERVLPDPEVRAFIRRAVGYSLTGETCEQCLFFLHGGGANGKSTLLTVIQAMMGDYARQAAPELLVSRGGDRHPTELADLFGARLVASVEVDEGKRLAETLVKQMTGGDKMKARFMRADFFEWTPTHKLFLAANHRPEIRGTDYAIWRRIHLVPFTVTIPPAERDGRLGAKLLAELPGILNWAIQGCLDWQRYGLGVPQAVKDATEEYRQEQDVLADFLAECCVIDPQAYAVAGVLHKAYTTWCEDGGVKPISSTAFGRRLTERGFRAEKPRIGGKQTRVWRGLGLATPTDNPPGTRSEPRYGSRRDFPGDSSEPVREDEMGKNAYQRVPGDERVPGDDPAVCAADGCMNAAPGAGLHCDGCLDADVKDEVPW